MEGTDGQTVSRGTQYTEYFDGVEDQECDSDVESEGEVKCLTNQMGIPETALARRPVSCLSRPLSLAIKQYSLESDGQKME